MRQKQPFILSPRFDRAMSFGIVSPRRSMPSALAASWTLAAILLTVLPTATATAAERAATPPTSIRMRDGFRVQLLRSAQEGESSWISLTFESEQRIVVGLDDHGLARLTLDQDRRAATWERLSQTESLRHVRGVLFAHGALYACATDSQGVYRLRDRDGDGQYEELKLLRHLAYQSRYGHGTNQLVLGPDQMLYVVNGNDVALPDPHEPTSPYRRPRKDWLLPNPHDAGHDDRVGYIARVDPDGQSWTVLAGGFRNQFDLAFHEDGEMFTWDADMEWDAGLPWYRPTRLNHVVSGGEYGWRWGTGKWPAWFPDSLPSTLDTGFGSPTGMVFGYRSDWPVRYRQALYMADWQHGRVLLVDLIPRGASYDASAEWFLEGGPLNVCDLAFGPDGALYFITGGRGSQSGLYRVTWSGDVAAPAAPVTAPDVAAAARQARQLRRRLESYHQQQDAAALDLIWSELGNKDVWLQFAARVALENQPLAGWRSRLANAADTLASRTALLALARVGEPSEQPLLVEKLLQLDWPRLTAEELLLPLRTLQLSCIRQGPLPAPQRQALLDRLDGLYPQASFPANWLLAELLVEFEAPRVRERTLQLLEQASTQEEQVQYAKTLVRTRGVWDRESARRMITWLARSRGLPGGKLVETTWQHLRADLEELLDEPARLALAEDLRQLAEPLPAGEAPPAAPRPFVRHWAVADLQQDVAGLRAADRSVERGEQALAAAQCLRCHRLGDRGGQNGPDLTDVERRYDGRALLESIVEPSKQVDPKYFNAAFRLTDGRIVSGRTTGVSRDELTIEIDPLTGRSLIVPRADIEESLSNTTSPMPTGLLDTLSRDDILDLIALLRR